MKYFVSLVALSIIGLMPKAMFACPSGWEYVYEQGVPSAGYDFSDQGTHYVGVGTMYDSNMFFRNLLVVDISAFAEPPYDTLWTRVYDSIMGEGRAIVEVPNGFVIAGLYPEYTDSGGPHVLMVMIDDIGEVMWNNSEAQGMGNSVTTTPDGGFLVTGKGRLFMDDLLLVKYDEAGDTVWTRTYGAGGYDEGHAISPTSDGNYVIAGTKGASLSGQNGELWWLKVGGSGEIIWEHTHGVQNHDYWGTSIMELEDGGFIIGGGQGEQGVEVDKKLVIIKTDASGEIEWMKEHYACLYFQDPTPYWVDATADGRYITTGMGFNFMKLDSTGEIEWRREYISEYLNPVGCCVRQTSQGRYVAIGVAEDMFYMIDADQNGKIWIPGVEENSLPSTLEINVLTAVGQEIVFGYLNFPEGFHVSVFDASGRKVDELHSAHSSGTITWGENASRGVYFVKDVSDKLAGAKKVVIVK